MVYFVYMKLLRAKRNVIGVLIGFAIVFVGGIYVGVSEYQHNLVSAADGSTVTVGLSGASDTQPSDIDMGQFWQAYNLLKLHNMLLPDIRSMSCGPGGQILPRHQNWPESGPNRADLIGLNARNHYVTRDHLPPQESLRHGVHLIVVSPTWERRGNDTERRPRANRDGAAEAGATGSWSGAGNHQDHKELAAAAQLGPNVRERRPLPVSHGRHLVLRPKLKRNGSPPQQSRR